MSIQTINTVTGEILSDRPAHKPTTRRKAPPKRPIAHKPSGTTKQAAHELLFVLAAGVAVVGYALTR